MCHLRVVYEQNFRILILYEKLQGNNKEIKIYLHYLLSYYVLNEDMRGVTKCASDEGFSNGNKRFKQLILSRIINISTNSD